MKTIAPMLMIVLSSLYGPKAKFVDPYTIGNYHKMRSQILNEDRGYCVYLPHDYAERDEAYPVLYLLDGHRHFHYITGMIDYLSRYPKVIPPMIVVDIEQQHRSRDMTPTKDSRRPNDTGGAGKFLMFLHEELIPHIDARYRTNSPRTISGYSLSGLFVMYALVHRPETFDAYIMSSPSIWWDDHLLLHQVEPFLQKHKILEKHVFFAVGDKERQVVQDYYKALRRIVEEHKPERFRIVMQRLKGESHSTVCIPAFYRGIVAMFNLPVKEIGE